MIMKPFTGLFYNYKKGKKLPSVNRICIFKNAAGCLCKQVNSPWGHKFKTEWFSFHEKIKGC